MQVNRMLLTKSLWKNRSHNFLKCFCSLVQPNKVQDGPALNYEKYEKDKSSSPLSAKPLYLDVQATTPVDSRVLDAMIPYFITNYGNPHSRTHAYGWESEAAVEKARKQVADLIGADAKDVVFTSGATESNNMAVKGVAHFYGERRKHIITTQIEHKCVLDSCRILETEGFDVSYLPVQNNGILSLKVLEEAIQPNTSLVSVMAVNNEIGVKQPMKEIGALCRSKKVFFHTDAAQAVGKIPINVDEMNIDLMSISGHKIYGPKGVGALYVRRRPRVRVQPIQNGGGQERGMRSGTVPTPLVVGFGTACEVAGREMEYDRIRAEKLSKRLIDGIMGSLPDVIRNGDPEINYPGCVNLSFAYIEGEGLLMALKDVALSSGSACTSASLEPSYVLRAIGTDEGLAHTSISDDTIIQNVDRFGSDDIYSTIHRMEEIQDYICVGQTNNSGDARAVLFVKMKNGYTFNNEFKEKIIQKITKELFINIVPEVILEIKDIPYSVNNKRAESVIRKIVATNKIPKVSNIRNPECLKYYCDNPKLVNY